MSQSNLKPGSLSTQSKEENLFEYSNVNKKRRLEEIETTTGKLMFSFGEEGTIFTKLCDPFYFSIHPTMDIIIFWNSYDRFKQVYTLGGDHITTFTVPIHYTVALVMTEHFLYITSVYDCCTSYLLQFTDFNIVKKSVNKLPNRYPKGLACDTQGNVYFIEEFEEHIIVYDSDMIILPEIDIGQHRYCVDMFVERDNLVLLSRFPPRIIFLTLNGKFLRGINIINDLSFPHSFCSNQDGIIVVSDSRNDVLKVFSFKGINQDSSYMVSIIHLDSNILNSSYAFSQRIALVQNSKILIISTLDCCLSIALS